MTSDEGLSELRVRIPVRLYHLLYSVRLLSGRRMSEVVTEALEAYVEKEVALRRLAGDEGASPLTVVDGEKPRANAAASFDPSATRS